MNRQAKSAIKSLVLTLRHKLEDDFAIQLKRYGFAGERWLDLERLPHIQRDDQATIDHFRLKTALEQQLRRMGVDPEKATPQQRAEAVDWFVREVAFTHLNRLVASSAWRCGGSSLRSSPPAKLTAAAPVPTTTTATPIPTYTPQPAAGDVHECTHVN